MLTPWVCEECGAQIAQVFANYEISKWLHNRFAHPGVADALAYGLSIVIGLVIANNGGRNRR